jgi:ankyrin repeat protein
MHRLLTNAVICPDAPHNARLVELLLQRGVPLEEVNEQGETALMVAVRLNRVEVSMLTRQFVAQSMKEAG